MSKPVVYGRMRMSTWRTFCVVLPLDEMARFAEMLKRGAMYEEGYGQNAVLFERNARGEPVEIEPIEVLSTAELEHRLRGGRCFVNAKILELETERQAEAATTQAEANAG
jgi:hypothetical protein